MLYFLPLLLLQTISAASAAAVLSTETIWPLLNPGWNLGNSLDAIPDETSWGNPLVTPMLLDQIKASGYKSIRIPVTWTDHFATQAPNYTISTTWLDRVVQIVTWSLDRQFWVVLNVHHDSWQWATLPLPYEKLEAVWRQLATRFKNHDLRLILEPLNEPVGPDTVEAAEAYNEMNARFVKIVRASGGRNAQRVLTLPGLKTDIRHTVNWFKEPEGAKPYFPHVHTYSPWGFVSGSWGMMSWGTTAEKAELEATFASLAQRFNSTPALIGEWGTTGGNGIELGSKWRFFEFFVRTATKYKLASQLWDNGEHYDRVKGKWRDPIAQGLVVNAAKGRKSVVPAEGQTQTLYFMTSTAVWPATEIKLDNPGGLAVTGIVNAAGQTLKMGTDYTVPSPASVVVSEQYLKQLSITDSLGLKDTLTISFSGNGTPKLPFGVRAYHRPSASSETVTITDASRDYAVQVSDGGSTLATVKATKVGGGYLKEEWTQWLGPLHAGRINWGGDFGFWEGHGVVLYPSLLATIKASGGPVELEFEFWPRTDAENKVMVTVEVV